MPTIHVSLELNVEEASFTIAGGVGGKKGSWQLVAEAPPIPRAKAE